MASAMIYCGVYKRAVEREGWANTYTAYYVDENTLMVRWESSKESQSKRLSVAKFIDDFGFLLLPIPKQWEFMPAENKLLELQTWLIS